MTNPLTFRAYGYDLSNDAMAWNSYTRESLVAEIAGTALARFYSPDTQRQIGTRVLIGRAARDGLTPAECEAVVEDWRRWWAGREDATLVGDRIADAALFAKLSADPDPVEIAADLRAALAERELAK